jgi:hypothetical protein
MFGRQPPFSLGERRCHPASPGAWTGRRDGASMLSSAGQVLWTFGPCSCCCPPCPPPPPCPPVGTLWPSQNRAQPAGVRQEGSELPQPWGVAKRLTPSPPFRNKCVCVWGGSLGLGVGSSVLSTVHGSPTPAHSTTGREHGWGATLRGASQDSWTEPRLGPGQCGDGPEVGAQPRPEVGGVFLGSAPPPTSRAAGAGSGVPVTRAAGREAALSRVTRRLPRCINSGGDRVAATSRVPAPRFPPPPSPAPCGERPPSASRPASDPTPGPHPRQPPPAARVSGSPSPRVLRSRWPEAAPSCSPRSCWPQP